MNFFWQGTEAKKFVTLTITHTTRMDLIITLCSLAYPSAEDLVDGRRLLERALGLNDGPHLLHVEHERVQRLLDVVHLLLLQARLLRPASAAHSRSGRRPLLPSRDAHQAVAARRTRAEVGAGGVRPAAAFDSARS